MTLSAQRGKRARTKSSNASPLQPAEASNVIIFFNLQRRAAVVRPITGIETTSSPPRFVRVCSIQATEVDQLRIPPYGAPTTTQYFFTPYSPSRSRHQERREGTIRQRKIGSTSCISFIQTNVGHTTRSQPTREHHTFHLGERKVFAGWMRCTTNRWT